MSATFFFTMEIIIGILGGLLIIAFFVIWNLLKKIEKSEDIINNQLVYINKFNEAIVFSDDQLKKIDERGTFKSDDEVGFFFKQIKDLQELLNQFNINKI